MSKRKPSRRVRRYGDSTLLGVEARAEAAKKRSDKADLTRVLKVAEGAETGRRVGFAKWYEARRQRDAAVGLAYELHDIAALLIGPGHELYADICLDWLTDVTKELDDLWGRCETDNQ